MTCSPNKQPQITVDDYFEKVWKAGSVSCDCLTVIKSAPVVKNAKIRLYIG